MARVKICGINDPAGFDAAVAADWVGFVFFPPSPRFVTPAQAAMLSSRHAGGPQRVGLFVKPTVDEVAATLAAVKLDVLQIYADDVAVFQEHFGLPVWQAIGVAGPDDLPTASQTAGLVIEAKPPKGSTRPGGNATAFDWSILRDWRAPAFWVLAGGLTPENVAAAIGTSGAAAVDTSSGVEASPGRKDPTLIGRFIEEARKDALLCGVEDAPSAR
jgi:phosphoribosylanthranilate isomerase